jgi:hypothetical protein
MRVFWVAVGLGVVIGVGAQGPAQQPTQQAPVTQPSYDCHAGGNCYGIPCVRVNQDANGNCEPGKGVIPYPPGDPRLGVPVIPTGAWPDSPPLQLVSFSEAWTNGKH